MALAKFLEDIVERYYDDLRLELDAPARTPEEMAVRLESYRRAFEHLKNDVEELLDVITDPNFTPASEFGRQRTQLTSLERTVASQQAEIESLRRELQNHAVVVADLESERRRLESKVPGRLQSILAQNSLRGYILDQFRHPLSISALQTTRRALAPLGVTPLTPPLYWCALTHRSYANENPDKGPLDNLLLSHVGVSLYMASTTLIVADRYPGMPVHSWENIEQHLTNLGAVAAAARRWSLDEYLLLGKGEQRNRRKLGDKVLSDAFYALIGAVLLDHGQWAALELASRAAHESAARYGLGESAVRAISRVDPKTELQQWAQGCYRILPEYAHEREGPDHAAEYAAVVSVNGRQLAKGYGTSKKAAETAAAENALRMITREGLGNKAADRAWRGSCSANVQKRGAAER